MTELCAVMITPYSLAKSRTGGIIGRLISQADLEFVGARMYMPSDAFVDELVDILNKTKLKPLFRKEFEKYINDHFRAENAAQLGMTNRMMMLLFRGKNAVKALREVVGSPTSAPAGNTVRGTYGDCVMVGQDITYFEPAVILPWDNASNRSMLSLFARYAEKDGGVLEGRIDKPKASVETTLVMLKPTNFLKRSSRPGNIIDMFSKTDLKIVGAKLFKMSVSQAMEFYGFLEEIFVDKLSFLVTQKLHESFEGMFDFAVTDEDVLSMTEILKRKNAHCEVAKIIEYMTGRNPDTVLKDRERKAPGTATCLALLYQGENAIDKIRQKLGPTDPKKAEGGTVRSDYGNDLMKNGAHASDSVKSANRERPIIGLVGHEPSEEKRLILEWLKGTK